jgi:hypothetical protein
MLLDERYPSCALLQWQHHQLSDPPRHLSFHRLPGAADDVTILTWSLSGSPMMYSYRPTSLPPMSGPSGLPSTSSLPVSTHSRRALSSFAALATPIHSMMIRPETPLLNGMAVLSLPTSSPSTSSSPTFFVLQVSHHGMSLDEWPHQKWYLTIGCVTGSIICQAHRIGAITSKTPTTLAANITDDERISLPGGPSRKSLFISCHLKPCYAMLCPAYLVSFPLVSSMPIQLIFDCLLNWI